MRTTQRATARNRAFLFAVLVLLLALPVSAAAESVAPVAPEGAAVDVPEIVVVADGISKAVLQNGLEIVVVEDHSLPLVTVEMVVRNGAFTEPPEYDGLSHLYEHMFFKGNEKLPDQEAYMARQRELGMSWNGTTSTERVNYFFTMTADRWWEGMEFMRDAIRYPLFDQKELEKERIVVLDELSRNESSPFFHLRQAVDKALWFAHPSRKNTIGDRDIIATATREKMVTVQGKFYMPNNSALFVSGDVEPTAVVAAAVELYGDWEAGDDPFTKYPLPEHPPLEKAQALIVEKQTQVAVVSIAWHGPDTDRDVDATYAADVFSFIVDQQGSKFQKALVDSGIALQASVSYYTQKNVGPIHLTIVALPEKIEEALKVASAEIDKFDDADYYNEEQIEIAKTLLEVSDIYSREKTSDFTHTLTFWWSSAGLEYYLGYIKNLKAVSRDGMNKYIQTYVHEKPYVIGLLITPESREALGITEDKLLEWFAR